MKKYIILLIGIFLLTNNSYAAEKGYLAGHETSSVTAQFSPGIFSELYRSSMVKSVNDSSFYNGKYTNMYNLTTSAAKGQKEYGTVEAVNKCKNDDGKPKLIGIAVQELDNLTLTFRLKLDSTENKNISVAFSYIDDENGLSLGYHNNKDKIRKYCDKDGNAYINIGEYVSETTEWQTVTVTLNLEAYNMIADADGNVLGEADWDKASAIHIASLKSDNVFKDNPDAAIDIRYGDITLGYSGVLRCDVTVSVCDENGNETGKIGSEAAGKIVLENHMSENRTAVIIFAVYKDGYMTEMRAKTVEAEANGKTEFMTGTVQTSGADKAVAYVVSDYENMIPITRRAESGR